MERAHMDSGVASRLASMQLGDGVATGEVDHVFVVVWRKGVDLPRFRVQEEGLRAAVRKNRRRTGVICVIEPSSKPPSEELKHAARDMLKQHEEKIACVACVIEGDGFRAAMIRAVLSTIQLLVGKRGFEMKFCSNVVDASAWVGHQVGLPSAGLSSATEELRVSLDPVNPAEPTITQVRRSLRGRA